MNNSEKGHQGFTSKYKTLGKTQNIRIPISIKDKIETLMYKLESIGSQKGLDKVDNLLDLILEELDKNK